ncbi:MAG: hypothetical protein ABR981_00980 [Candidatus Micrarchaeaceae archaeon]|jgi:5'(3')-deoxyribonucleotidase
MQVTFWELQKSTYIYLKVPNIFVVEFISRTRAETRASLRSMLRLDRSIVIAIDIDQTLADVHTVMIKLYNEAKGTSYTVEDHKDWDFKSIGSNYVEMMGFYVQAWKYHWKEIKLMGNRESLINSEEYFVQDISSTRDYHAHALTGGTCQMATAWLKMQGINWLPYFYDATKIKKLNLRYEMYFDDSPKLAEDITSRDYSFQFLIDRPYNRYIPDTDRIMRVSGIDEASQEVISAAIDIGRKKKHYQTPAGQAFLREGGIDARDRIVAHFRKIEQNTS